MLLSSVYLIQEKTRQLTDADIQYKTGSALNIFFDVFNKKCDLPVLGLFRHPDGALVIRAVQSARSISPSLHLPKNLCPEITAALSKDRRLIR